MADPAESRSDPAGTSPAAPPRAPRWVKVFAVILVLVILLAGALLVFGGGEHGPGRHTSSGGDATPSSLDADSSHRPPEGGH